MARSSDAEAFQHCCHGEVAKVIIVPAHRGHYAVIFLWGTVAHQTKLLPVFICFHCYVYDQSAPMSVTIYKYLQDHWHYTALVKLAWENVNKKLLTLMLADDTK